MTIHRFSALSAVALMFAAAFSSAAQADTAMLGSSSDTYIRDGRSYTVSGVDVFLDSRQLGFVPYIQFDMSGLNIDTISSATLRLWKVAGSRSDGITNGRFATYGLNDDPNNTLQYWHETNDFDPNDGFNGLDFRNVGLEWTNSTVGVDRTRLTSLDPEDGGVSITEVVNNTTGEITVTGADLVAFLNSRVSAGGLVTLVFPLEDTQDRGYGIASKENPDSNLRPRLDLEFTVVPEPATGILFLAASAVTLLGRRREA